jgi:hypothetical protein
MPGDIDQHGSIEALLDPMAEDAGIAIDFNREAKPGEHPPGKGIPGE